MFIFYSYLTSKIIIVTNVPVTVLCDKVNIKTRSAPCNDFRSLTISVRRRWQKINEEYDVLEDKIIKMLLLARFTLKDASKS